MVMFLGCGWLVASLVWKQQLPAGRAPAGDKSVSGVYHLLEWSLYRSVCLFCFTIGAATAVSWVQFPCVGGMPCLQLSRLQEMYSIHASKYALFLLPMGQCAADVAGSRNLQSAAVLQHSTVHAVPLLLRAALITAADYVLPAQSPV